VKAARLRPPVLAGATLSLIGANALPTAQRKHRLQRRQRMLVQEVRRLDRREDRLRREIHALEHDPFYLERLVVETWHGRPAGAEAFRPYEAAPDDDGPPLD